jgi:hypothetical protein
MIDQIVDFPAMDGAANGAETSLSDLLQHEATPDWSVSAISSDEAGTGSKTGSKGASSRKKRLKNYFPSEASSSSLASTPEEEEEEGGGQGSQKGERFDGKLSRYLFN